LEEHSKTCDFTFGCNCLLAGFGAPGEALRAWKEGLPEPVIDELKWGNGRHMSHEKKTTACLGYFLVGVWNISHTQFHRGL